MHLTEVRDTQVVSSDTVMVIQIWARLPGLYFTKISTLLATTAEFHTLNFMPIGNVGYSVFLHLNLQHIVLSIYK